MERVTGIGGVFITADDPTALREWYREPLGIDVQPWGGTTFHTRCLVPGPPRGG